MRIIKCKSKISIHAPRGGSDAPDNGARVAARGYFNPRSPRGERPSNVDPLPIVFVFQSTLPAGGATLGDQKKNCH